MCPRCHSEYVFEEDGYRTVFRCGKCGFCGNDLDFGGVD